MATEIRFRRGTTTQHAAFTGALAEVTVDTDKKVLVVHDGATPGGFPLLRSSDLDTKASARGYIAPNFNLANNAVDAANDIDFPAGVVGSEQATPLLMSHAAATAQLDVAYGVGNGGRFDSVISDGWWHCFIISNGVTVSRGFSKSLNPTAQPNWPAGFTHYRRVASWPRVGGVLVALKQRDDRFYYVTPVTDRNSPAARPWGVIALSIPVGLITRPMLAVDYQMAQNVSIRVTFGNGDGTCETRVIDAQTPNTAGAVANVAATFEHFYSSSNAELFASQINNTGVPALGTWTTFGWVDTRGRI